MSTETERNARFDATSAAVAAYIASITGVEAGRYQIDPTSYLAAITDLLGDLVSLGTAVSKTISDMNKADRATAADLEFMDPDNLVTEEQAAADHRPAMDILNSFLDPSATKH